MKPVSHGTVEPPLLGLEILHALAVRDVDQIERRGGDEILRSRQRAQVVGQMQLQLMRLGLIEPNAALIAR
jgi:hypothetical protein